MEKKKNRKNNRGFTLVEIMIVLAIMALIFGLVGPNVIGIFGDAKKQSAKIQMNNYKAALDAFYIANGFYPTNNQGGLDALVKKPTTGRVPENFPDKGFLKKDRVEPDPWKNQYIYNCENGNDYTLHSMGPDAQDGTDDDIKAD